MMVEKMKTAREALKAYFGYDNFRPMQEQVIEAVLQNQDSIVLMPTGGGKSLCYQIPALVREGLAIIISPLISLMKDQVEGLRGNGVPAACLNSSQDEAEQRMVAEQVRDGSLKLLYLSPEKLLSPAIGQFLETVPISLFAIDEAHCISSWGHDFRKEYTRLGNLKKAYPKVPILALTATADKLTRADIATQLNLAGPNYFIASFDRPNIRLRVMPGRNRLQQILNFIESHEGQSGIIYCLSRKSTEKLAEALQAKGIPADAYHAGLSSNQRNKVQEAFIRDDTPVICATVAFGMGIDKSNVRWIMHYNLPKNMESYYQEIGRAGRDGLPAEALLFYSFADVAQLRTMLEGGPMEETKLDKLERMQQFAEARECRRRILLSYFNEYQKENCGNCDVCLNPPERFDGTVLAQKALSAVVRLKEQVGMGMLIDVLRGSSRKELLERGYDKIKTYGAGSELSLANWQDCLQQMIHQGLLEIAYTENKTLRLTPASKEVLYEKRKVEMVRPTRQAAKPKVQQPVRKSVEEGLFQHLRTLRKTLADKHGIPPYLVFHDATLREMVEQQPTTELQMRNVSGVGKRKYQLYGDRFINAILEYLQRNAQEGRRVNGGSMFLTLQDLQAKKPVETIARNRNVKPQTIWQHIAKLCEEGHQFDLWHYVTPEEIDRVYKAIQRTGETVRIKRIYEHLNEEVDYHLIRVGLGYYLKVQAEDAAAKA